jgi:hypothetical protein
MSETNENYHDASSASAEFNFVSFKTCDSNGKLTDAIKADQIYRIRDARDHSGDTVIYYQTPVGHNELAVQHPKSEVMQMVKEALTQG